MTIDSVVTRRLASQRLTRAGFRRPADVVAWFGAVQAQEFEPAKWGIGLRMADAATSADIASAFDAGQILRTHVMRPTWHFVAQADIRWLVELTGPRVLRSLAVYDRQLELDARTVTRGLAVIERALSGRTYLTRAELADHLARAGLAMKGQRLAHMAAHAELGGLICSGPRRGRQSTYALLAERAPDAQALPPDEALATLARRFLQSHGPATLRDFVWWSGLLTADARRAFEIVCAKAEVLDGLSYWTIGPGPGGRLRDRAVHLLPVYDEYVVAYRDRVAVPHGPSAVQTPGQGSIVFQHAVVVDGRIAGTWRVQPRARRATIRVAPLARLTRADREGIDRAAGRYARFVSGPVDLVIAR